MLDIHCFFYFCIIFSLKKQQQQQPNKQIVMEKSYDKQEVVKDLHNSEEVNNMVVIAKPRSMQSLIWLRLAPQSSGPY